MKEIVLPPANGITGKSTNIHKEYWILRNKSSDFKIWFKRQYAKQDARCFYCSTKFVGKRINVEHIKPRSKGGDNRSQNLVLSCADCNRNKGNKILDNNYIERRHRKMKKLRRRSAIGYKHEIKVQHEIAESLSWIT